MFSNYTQSFWCISHVQNSSAEQHRSQSSSAPLSFTVEVKDLRKKYSEPLSSSRNMFIFQTHHQGAHARCRFLLRFQIFGAKAAAPIPDPCEPGYRPDPSARSALSTKRQAGREWSHRREFIWSLKTSFHQPVVLITLLACDLMVFRPPDVRSRRHLDPWCSGQALYHACHPCTLLTVPVPYPESTAWDCIQLILLKKNWFGHLL